MGDSGVLLHLDQGPPVGCVRVHNQFVHVAVRAGDHCAELVHPERFPIQTNSLLNVERPARRVEPNPD